MSVDLMVQGWSEGEYNEVKVFGVDKYGLEDFYFANDSYYKLCPERGLHYCIERQYKEEFPTVNFSNTKWADLAESLGLVGEAGDYSCGTIPLEDLSAVISKITRIVNTNAVDKLIVSPAIHGNIFYCGRDKDQVFRALNDILKVLMFAKQKGKEVYWG